MTNLRLDFQRIAAAVPQGASVLDLGCGEGDMLAHLQQARNVHGVGADIARANLIRCFERGIEAVYFDINKGLSLFSDNAYDVVILSQTLQSVHIAPPLLLQEMLRIGRLAIVSFPNFGYWRMRLQLLAGAMPRDRLLPHTWDSTPNVRYCTIKDFEALCIRESLHIEQKLFLLGEQQIERAPNGRAQMAIYCLRRASVAARVL
jgi:methionine biosynthesis protein MetW